MSAEIMPKPPKHSPSRISSFGVEEPIFIEQDVIRPIHGTFTLTTGATFAVELPYDSTSDEIQEVLNLMAQIAMATSPEI